MTFSADPARPPLDTPLGAIASFDLSTTTGMALLRRFDAQLRLIGDADAQRAAVRRLSCRAPLSSRATGLLALPGGALALRREETVLVCDPASACTAAGPAATGLRAQLAGLPLQSVAHAPGGLLLRSGLPAMEAAQAITLVEPAGLLAPLWPQAASWRGPALLRWGQGGAVAWEMVPAPAPLALGASVVGEPLAVGEPLPRDLWDAPTGDDRYQLLATGLAAYLDELLGNEVSDLLRFELADHWTDGEESLASLLADGLGLLPSCFAVPAEQPAGLAALQDWPRAAAAVAASAAPMALLGIAPQDWSWGWQAEARQAFLRQVRRAVPADAAVLLAEGAAAMPVPLAEIGADRTARQAVAALAVLLPLPATPLDLLLLGRRVAQGCGGPVQLAAPCWGLWHRCDPQARLEAGNGGWYSLGGGLEELEDVF
ncbi:hypothetical protein E0493_19560 [Roseomonas sp. M0104]|uniref:Uncharacterized protein n=1 Tax=Teichococcus coralli TaxID=2545983 RepID=A0A845BQ62_9PROT|nr:hypothetical protein [Pseudoroseomonas coralli]MXP65549.1 hypothetical protein [Pseudoroseomonas coralli]